MEVLKFLRTIAIEKLHREKARTGAFVESVCHPRQTISCGGAGVEGIYRLLLTVIHLEDG